VNAHAVFVIALCDPFYLYYLQFVNLIALSIIRALKRVLSVSGWLTFGVAILVIFKFHISLLALSGTGLSSFLKATKMTLAVNVTAVNFNILF